MHMANHAQEENNQRIILKTFLLFDILQKEISWFLGWVLKIN